MMSTILSMFGFVNLRDHPYMMSTEEGGLKNTTISGKFLNKLRQSI